jgi:glycine C-acetyltransferase/8-amino-7-oxononanoate synthase
MMFDLNDELQALKNAGLLRKVPGVEARSATHIRIDGRELLLMASNDYLGLSQHPQLISAGARAAEQWGAGSGAARLISGSSALFDALEKRLADFKHTQAALVFSTGYMANLGLLSALAGADDIIFSDELNHASIIDGCRLSRARVSVYPHVDIAALETQLQQSGHYRRRIIVTDALFSMDGDIAPLPRLLELARTHDAVLIVDDAHGTGVLGPDGRGTIAHFGLKDCNRLIVMGTMGKALGCFGAFVAGSRVLIDYLVNRARSFIFTTAMPPANVASALAALDLVEQEPTLRERLQENTDFMHSELRSLGFDLGSSQTQIIPIMAGEASTAVAMAADLMEQGIFLQAIRPPTVPQGAARLRLTITALHTRQQLEQVVTALKKTGRTCKLIS